ncbi:MAG: hypothetical protein K9J30_06955 [Bacteroidales bacterium]|nr:hypothetical protein [Bacteroidales bacterium]
MRKSLFVILLLFSVRSCFYVDTQEFETEIYLDFEPEVTISSNFDQLDNIRITDSIYFSYEIQIDTGKLYFSDLYLDNYLIYRSSSTADSIWIFPYYIEEDGDYDLTILAYYKSLTGSLADVLDAEPYVEDTTWVITISRTN